MTARRAEARLGHGSEAYVAVQRGRLYVREIGSGPPLVVLHGGPDFNHNYLLPEMDLLADSFRLVYYDQRGRGKSSVGVAAEDVTIESEVEDIDALRQHLGRDTISLLGHSWGCLLAMEYASRHQDRTDRLVLLNAAPASHGDLLRFREHRQAVEAENLSRMKAIAATQAFVEGDLQAEVDYYRAHFRATLRRPDLLETVVARLRSHFTADDILKARAIEHALYDQTWRSPRYDLVGRLEGSKTPALLIHGDRDLIPLFVPSHIADAMPEARLVVLEDCGHFAYLERPVEVGRAIRSFIPECG